MREVVSGCHKKTIKTTGINEFEHLAKLHPGKHSYIICFKPFEFKNFKAMETTAIRQRAESINQSIKFIFAMLVIKQQEKYNTKLETKNKTMRRETAS